MCIPVFYIANPDRQPYLYPRLSLSSPPAQHLQSPQRHFPYRIQVFQRCLPRSFPHIFFSAPPSCRKNTIIQTPSPVCSCQPLAFCSLSLYGQLLWLLHIKMRHLFKMSVTGKLRQVEPFKFQIAVGY